MASIIGQALIDIVKCEVLGGEAPEPRILKQIINTESGEGAEESGTDKPRTYIDDLIDIAEINGVSQLVADYFAREISSASKGAKAGEGSLAGAGAKGSQPEPLLATDSPAYRRLKEGYDAELYRALTFGTDLSRIGMILEREGIDYIPLKGAIIRDLYPKAWMRTSMDMDILVRESDIDRAVEAITSQPGFMKVNENGHHVLIESKTGWIIEMHFDLNAGESKARKYLDTAWDHAKPFTEVFAKGAPSAGASAPSAPHASSDATASASHARSHKCAFDHVFFYTYFIYHLSHHVYEEGGCGIRAILDLWILNQKFGLNGFYAPIDSESKEGGFVKSALQVSVETSLANVKLLEFARKMSAIADLWFGDGTLIGASGLSEGDLEDIERFIIIGGTHGTKTSSSLAAHYSAGTGRGKNRIFLSYESLSRRYRGLKGRRYLTPIYEVKRWANALTTGGAKRASEGYARDKSITDDEAERISRIMQNLGLDK